MHYGHGRLKFNTSMYTQICYKKPDNKPSSIKIRVIFCGGNITQIVFQEKGTFNHLLLFKWIMMDIIMVLHSTNTLRIDVIIYVYYFII